MNRLITLLICFMAGSSVLAGNAGFPIHNIQGNSGGFLTQTAYIAPAADTEALFGSPSISATYAQLDGQDYEALGFNMNFARRFELGYSMERLGLGDWNAFADKISSIYTGGLITDVDTKNASIVHNFSMRYNIYKENRENPLLPSLTAGIHFKWNESISQLNRDLMYLGGAKAVGYDHDHGTEFTLVASKFIPNLVEGHPIMASIGLRNSDAIQKGLLGFAGERETAIEANAFIFLTHQLVFGWEYKQENNLIGNKSNALVKDENDWWDLCLAYIVNKDLTIACAYANLGNILDKSQENVLAFQIKYNF